MVIALSHPLTTHTAHVRTNETSQSEVELADVYAHRILSTPGSAFRLQTVWRAAWLPRLLPKTEADTMSSRALKAWDTKRAKQAKATALMQMKACAASETLDISSLENIGRHLGLPYFSIIVDTLCPQEQAEAYKVLAAKSHDDLQRQNEYLVLGNVSLSLRELELQQEIRTLRGKAIVESSSYRQRGLLGLPVSVLDLLLTMNFDLADHIALSQTCRRLRSVYTHEIWAVRAVQIHISVLHPLTIALYRLSVRSSRE